MNKKGIALALKVLVSGGLIWLLLGSIDLQTAGDRILAANPLALLGAISVFVIQSVVIVWRWQAVMRAMNSGLPFLKTLAITYMGLFFNQALPSSVGGDAVRIYKAYKSGMDLNSAINGVMLDRVATMLGLVLLVIVAVPFFSNRLGPEETQWILPAVLLLAVGGVAGLVALMYLDNLPTRFSHYRVVHGLALLAADTRRVFLSPKYALSVLLISLIGHANVTFGIYLIAVALDIGISWVDCMVLMPPVLLMTTLPISIAGWGVREGAMVAMLALIGVPSEAALVLSILIGLAAVLTSLPGGLVWILSGDRNIKDVNINNA